MLAGTIGLVMECPPAKVSHALAARIMIQTGVFRTMPAGITVGVSDQAFREA
jgi:hypothetical protein